MRRVWLLTCVVALACANGQLTDDVLEDASSNDSSSKDATTDSALSDAGTKDVIVPTEAGCPSPTTQCGNVCVNTATDPDHCGTCTMVCDAPEGGVATCTGSVCGESCGDGGLSLCTDQCVNEQTDNLNCGGCTNACDGGLCNAGSCCAPGEVICSNACTNTQTDIAHCGSCTNACDAGTCANGTCVTTYKVGDYTAYSMQGSFTLNYLLGEKVVLSKAATLEEFGLISKGSGMHVTMALYTDKNGAPNALVAYTASTVVSASDQTIAPNTQASLAAGTYWMMAVYDSTGGPATDGTSGTNTIDYISFTYGSALPTTFPAATSYAAQDFNYYLVVQ